MRIAYFNHRECQIVLKENNLCGKHFQWKIKYKILEYLEPNTLIFKIVKTKVKKVIKHKK